MVSVSPSLVAGLTLAVVLFSGSPPQAQGTLSGQRQVWHVVDLTFQHDEALTEGGNPNPFYDFRLDVTFSHSISGVSYVVPGYFDADGNPADSGTTLGDIWRVRFVPDASGTWDWSVSFRSGTGVSVASDPLDGVPASFDGASGSFLVLPADPGAPGLRGKGMLRYEDQPLLRFAENHEYFLKNGADSPENLLGYFEFDGTVDTGGTPNDLDQLDGLHHFAPHLADYDALGGGPTWKGGKGKALVGGLNYLASVGVNSVYFLTYNIDGGDGGEVYPWASTGSKLRYDVGKLAQWSRVFDHMTDLGLVLHVVTQERENDTVLDFGAFGDQRKLYYRELVARFGCNLGVVWNIGEETSNSDADRMAFASYLRSLDPYQHPISVHTNPSELNQVYTPLLGFPDVELCSLQLDPVDVHDRTLEWASASLAAGRPWVVTNDEQNPADEGVVPDSVDPKHGTIRRDALWGNLLAGGGGAEFYFGYGWPDDDLDCEDWRSRSNLWDQVTTSLDFLRDQVPYQDMRAADELTGQQDQYCLALDGEVYLIYAPLSAAPVLDLAGSVDTFSLQWFDVDQGGALQSTQTATVTGPGQVALGPPPPGGKDWVAIVRRQAQRSPVLLSHSGEAVTELGSTTMLIKFHVTDPDGPQDLSSVGMFLFNTFGSNQGYYPAQYNGGDLFSIYATGLAGIDSGNWSYVVIAIDQAGNFTFDSGLIPVP